MARATMHFPPDFLWGTATASHQVEGNNTNNDWWQWEQQKGAILNGDRSGLACDWWANAEQDLDRMVELGTNAHRLSIEWSRVEPEPAEFSKEALERYRAILMGMKERGIEPMVTLHHFTNPMWLTHKGEWSSNLVLDYFPRYVRKVVDALGDLVTTWVTINEPLVYTVFRYLDGTFPAAGQLGWRAAFGAIRRLLKAHAIAYQTIKNLYPDSQVGFAKNIVILEPERLGALPKWWNKRADWLFNDLWLECANAGKLQWPLGREELAGNGPTFDFIGLNYYTRFYTKFPPIGGRLTSEQWGPNATISDGNYGEVYAPGMFKAIQRVVKYGKPIYITENGIPDDDDDLRPCFLLNHIREVWRAVSFNFPVMGYYHWSLIDNFEWDRGWTQRFGLYELDIETQERKLRKSGVLYREICQKNYIDTAMAEQFAPELLDTMFPG